MTTSTRKSGAVQFEVILFGSINALSAFQRMVNEFLKDVAASGYILKISVSSLNQKKKTLKKLLRF